jgi:hypothetical protein
VSSHFSFTTTVYLLNIILLLTLPETINMDSKMTIGYGNSKRDITMLFDISNARSFIEDMDIDCDFETMNQFTNWIVPRGLSNQYYEYSLGCTIPQLTEQMLISELEMLTKKINHEMHLNLMNMPPTHIQPSRTKEGIHVLF